MIAIDGPSASGKGTLARRIAEKFQLPHLDTGLTYRAVAKALIDRNLLLDDEQAAIEIATGLDFANLDKDGLSSHAIGQIASKVAVMAGVRKSLVAAQQAFAQKPPGAVLDGRDIGTVVCPDADVKFYVTATPEIRAERRYREMLGRGKDADFDEILQDLEERDRRDMGRRDSPLKKPDDALLLDTSKMDIESAFQTAVCRIDKVLAEKNRS